MLIPTINAVSSHYGFLSPLLRARRGQKPAHRRESVTEPLSA